MRISRLLWIFLIVSTTLGLTDLPTVANSPLQLLRLTPEGDDVPVSRQLVLQFDRPVVPLGRMERRSDEIPISIEPALACAWHWLNPTTLACQLDEQTAMSPATPCR